MARIHRRSVLDNYVGVVIHLEPDILEHEVKWTLGSITMNKANGGDGILAELFLILKDDAIKELYWICQQIKMLIFIPILKKVQVKVLVTHSCPTLCDRMDSSPPDSSVHRILQERILEWVSISFFRELSHPRDQTQVSHIAGKFFTVWATKEVPNYWTIVFISHASKVVLKIF